MVAGQRLEERPRARAAPPSFRAARSAVEIFLWSRAGIWLAGLFAFLSLEGARNPRTANWDDPALTRDLGAVTDIWARWDAVHYLRIAEHGYSAAEAAFFPLYPALLAGLGRVLGGHYVLAGILISLAAALGAFVLLEQLAERRLGGQGARRALVYLALFPTALFLQAVYSESLFLFLCLAAFVFAERGHFPEAGVVAGLAVLTRPTGAALVVALAVLAGRKAWQLATVVPVAAIYPLVLWQKIGDPWAFLHAQDAWHRQLSWAGPLGGVWDGLRAALAGVRQLASGSTDHVYWTAVSPDDASPFRVALLNVEAFGFLCLFVALTVVAWRRFGPAYGTFAAVSLAIPLSVPSERWPLLSLPRFGLVVFPFFLALAWLGGRHTRINAAIVGTSAVLLGVFVTQWVLWYWVA